MYNSIIVSSVLSWFAAQVIKTILHAIKFNEVAAERIVGSGGMPSSHTALVIAALVSVGRSEGVGSSMFGIMFVMSAVVIYDAMGVRRAAGLHAKALNNIGKVIRNLKDISSEEFGKDYKELKELLGHTPLEVVCGGILGMIIAFLIPVKR